MKTQNPELASLIKTKKDIAKKIASRKELILDNQNIYLLSNDIIKDEITSLEQQLVKVDEKINKLLYY